MEQIKKNILYISYDGMTDSLGQSQVIPYLQGLSKKGYFITLLSCEKPFVYKKNKDAVDKILKLSGIEWNPIKYHKRPAILSTIYDIATLLRKAKKLHQKKKFRLIHCRSYISALVGLQMKKRYNIPFLFDMRGFYADERVDGKLWNLNNPLYKMIFDFFKKKEIEFIKYSAATISLTNSGKKVLKQWAVCKENNSYIEVIPCSCDFSMFQIPEQEEKIKNRQSNGINEGTFVLSYLGSIGTWYMLEEMLDFFKVLLNKKNNALFLILTSEDPGNILKIARQKNISTDKIKIDFAQRKDLTAKLSVSDLSIFFIKPCFSKIASSPTKMGELLAMGIPIICNDGVGDVKEIIDYTKGGYTISSFTKESYENIVINLDALKTMDIQKMRTAAQRYYDLDEAVKKYENVYQQIINNNA